MAHLKRLKAIRPSEAPCLNARQDGETAPFRHGKPVGVCRVLPLEAAGKGG